MQSLIVSLILGVFLTAGTRAGAADFERPVSFPKLPAQARAEAGFVPGGWKIETKSRGDLNADGAPDLLLVLRMNDPKKVVKNDGFGVDELDTNPRMLVVAFADKATSQFSLALSDHALIPRHTLPNMDDPLGEVAIVKGTLRVSLGVFMSAGSWSTSQVKFTFRHQGGCFKLIGYDSSELKRNTGETTTISVNYLTQKAKIAQGNMENESEKVSWKTLRLPSLLCLDAVGDGLDFSPGI